MGIASIKEKILIKNVITSLCFLIVTSKEVYDILYDCEDADKYKVNAYY